MSSVAIYGWYGHGNVGDEAYKEAFDRMLPTHKITFVDRMPKHEEELKFDCLIVGGGGLLDQPVNGLQCNLPMAFVSVGGINPHPSWMPYLKMAKSVIVRDPRSFGVMSYLLGHSERVHMQPDLVFGKADPLGTYNYKAFRGPGSKPRILVLPNAHVLPNRDSPAYVASSWYWYSGQMAEILDELSDSYEIIFKGMCENLDTSDCFATGGIISQMRNPDRVLGRHSHALNEGYPSTVVDTFDLAVKAADIVITQRLHGFVFAANNRIPCVSISHHDKIRDVVEYTYDGIPGGKDTCVDYYGFSKKSFYTALTAAESVVHPTTQRDTIECTRSILEKEFFA